MSTWGAAETLQSSKLPMRVRRLSGPNPRRIRAERDHAETFESPLPIADPTALLYRLAKGLHNYRRPWRLTLGRWLDRPTVTVTDRATGLTFRCLRGADRMFGETFHSQVYDIPTVSVEPGDVVIDVGANHGFAACRFAYQGAKVVALEPNPSVYSLLLENIRTNHLGDHVQAIQKAVAGEPGTATLHATDRFGGGMSTLDPSFLASTGTPVDHEYEVEVTTLDRLMDELSLDRVRLVKLDCEGAELSILLSLSPSTLERIDAFALEYHDQAYPLADLIDVVLGWKSFSVSHAVTPGLANFNLHLVADHALRDWSTGA